MTVLLLWELHAPFSKGVYKHEMGFWAASLALPTLYPRANICGKGSASASRVGVTPSREEAGCGSYFES